MEIKKCILTKNDCYKAGRKATPKGIVVHSTGANNPNLKRYVQPDDGLLGVNLVGNHWNKSGIEKCVHAFIGKDKNGEVRVYQTLPYDICCWGCASGKKGSYNYNPAYIQFEICEDNLKDKNYFEKAFVKAIEYCAYLCKQYNISVDNVVSHNEANKRGYASNHSDCDHWLKKFGKDMNWFRAEVKARLGETKPTTTEKTPAKKTVSELANEVIAGKWGNGTDRKNRLTNAGYNYAEVQAKVNELLGSKPATPSFKVGSTVKLNKGAKTYTGGKLASFVYNRKHKVKQINGDRVVITYLGITVAAVNIKDLTLA